MKKRGVTVIEMVVSMFVGGLVLATMMAFLRTGDSVWNNTNAEMQTKDVLYLATTKMAPYFRNGLRIDASSTSKVAVIVWPKVDTVNGGFVTPLVDGDFYRFYLSDSSGAQGANGTILWMSKNGVPDAGWSMRGPKTGAVDLGTTNLSFSYSPTGDPDIVQVTVSTSKNAGTNKPVNDTATASLVLRNHAAAGL